MSENKTSWIIELINNVTAPAKQMTQGVVDFDKAVRTVSASLDGMDKASREQAEVALEDHKNLTELLKKEERAIRDLKAYIESLPEDPFSRGAHEKKLAEAETRARRYRDQLTEINHELKDISEQPEPGKTKANWGAMMVVINQSMELANKFGKALDFAQNIKDLEKNIRQMTDATGDALEDMTQRAYILGKEYQDGGDEVAKAAHVLSQNMQISMGEAFDLIEAGYKKGANLGGDMLSQLTTHGGKLRQVGIDGADAIALMVNAGKQGIFGSDALNSIKEADDSLREMGPRQIEALKGIGLAAKDFAGKTSWEAMQMISEAMDGRTVQEKQMVLKHIFKQSGENAGLGWVEGFSSIDMDINNMPNVERSGSAMREFLAKTELWFTESMGNIAITMQQLSGPVTTIAGMIPIVQTLTKMIKGTTVVQWLWNVAVKGLGKAIMSIPIIGWIAAIIAGVIWAYNEFEEFRAVIDGLWETAKAVFNNMWQWIKLLVAPIRIIIAFAMDGTEGAKAEIEKLKQEAIEYGEGVADIYSGNAFKRGYDKSLEESAAKKKEEEAPTLVEETAGTTPKHDGKGGKKDNELHGLSIDGSSGGGKSITMNLEIKNYFQKMAGDMDLQKAANKISEMVMDRMRDTLIIAG
ncbi:MAG: phage tail tape measure protein [Bacteroidetes bacterium]|nr:phage tail tape measure protein [Bacteroidota bacterium]